MLEPYDGKLSRTVLRGTGGRKTPRSTRYGLKEDALPLFKLIAFTATLLCCSACVPYPHMEAVSPAIWGLVTESGEPVSGYVLFRTAG